MRPRLVLALFLAAGAGAPPACRKGGEKPAAAAPGQPPVRMTYNQLKTKELDLKEKEIALQERALNLQEKVLGQAQQAQVHMQELVQRQMETQRREMENAMRGAQDAAARQWDGRR